MRSLFRDPRGMIPHTLALAYALLGYVLGWLGLFAASWLVNLLAMVLLAHAMVIAAYMIHECSHHTVFRDPRYNTRLGKALGWLCGSCYGDYENLREKHMRHHVDNADVLGFDYRELLQRWPLLRRLVESLEWAYIPACEIIMHAMLILGPFVLPGQAAGRGRVLRVLALRLPVFALMGWFAPKALLLYGVAYLLMVTFLRFMDAFQHNYEAVSLAENPHWQPGHKGDSAYEQVHTFSNPVTLNPGWLNLLSLNFAYHNAHHDRPTAPWYRLPALHWELYGEGEHIQVLRFVDQLRCFHRNRVARVMAEVDEFDGLQHRAQEGVMVGANGVSFLTVV